MNREFLKGRYGIDRLSIALVIISVLFINMENLWVIGVIILGYVIFRGMSKNKSKRYQELQKFDRITYKIKPYFNSFKISIVKAFKKLTRKSNMYRTRLKQSKQFVFIKCPNCKKMLRLPKNRGKLNVSCPVCKHKFIKKT